MFDRILLHVGPPKTGTSSIQAFVWKNRAALRAQGVYVPRAGRGGGQHIELPAILAAVAGRARQRRLNIQANIAEGAAEARREKFFADLDRELSSTPPCHTLMFMSEAIFRSGFAEIRAYREALGRYAPRLESLMYLRRQDRWLGSRTLQNRKAGNRESLDIGAGGPDRFAANVRAWHAQSDRCHIRRFDREFLVNGSLLQDFCAAIGANPSGLDMTEIWSNPAVLQEQLELVDALNPKIAPLPYRRQIQARSHFLALCSATLGGTRIAFPRAAAMEIFDSFGEINRWLRDTVDPNGPPLFFHADFSGYADRPANDGRYTLEQLGRLLAAIAPRGAPKTGRGALIEQILDAFLDPDGFACGVARPS